MNIDLNTMIEKYNNCLKNLNPDITCETCFYHSEVEHEKCKTCYVEMLGLPVNNTNWLKK